MSVLSLIHDDAVLAGATGAVYTAGVTTVAAASILARSPERRRDAEDPPVEASLLPLIFTSGRTISRQEFFANWTPTSRDFEAPAFRDSVAQPRDSGTPAIPGHLTAPSPGRFRSCARSWASWPNGGHPHRGTGSCSCLPPHGDGAIRGGGLAPSAD